MSTALTLAPAEARRFHRRMLLLDTPAPDVATALAHHGFIQIDPINVCGRMHDLILRNRVAGYREGDLFRHLHGAGPSLPASARQAFEHHLPDSSNLAALPLDAWPYLLAAMRRRTEGEGAWSGKLDAPQETLAKRILAEIAARGPLSSAEIDDDQRGHHGWGAQATLARMTLQKLFFHGRLLIARREGLRRYYDLPERILPAAILRRPEPSAAETTRWITLLKLRQRRLVALRPAEVAAVEDLVQAVTVPGCPRLYCLRTDLPLLTSAAPTPELLLLAPLEPLIYNRVLTRRLWEFDYTWEAYTPEAKRVRGYYALPVLAGETLVGHLDPKADRTAGQLRVVNRSLRRGHVAAPALQALAQFLGLKVGRK